MILEVDHLQLLDHRISNPVEASKYRYYGPSNRKENYKEGKKKKNPQCLYFKNQF